jgi:GTP cyclohydrolase I
LAITRNFLENVLNDFAPLELAENWDNVGLLVSSSHKEINNILLALDLTDDVLNEAISRKIDFIITHHPIIFKPLKKITTQSQIQKRIIKLIQNDISLYTAHTNLDSTVGGTNDVLFDLLELKNRETLFESNSDKYTFGLGRVGELKSPMGFIDFANYVKCKLGINSMSYSSSSVKQIKKIALCTGSASDNIYIDRAVHKNCDAYITGDVTYHNAQYAVDSNINIIDGTHFATEHIFKDSIKKHIEKKCFESNLTVNILKSNVERNILTTI